MNKLSKRLEVVASFVNDNSKVIDIGCDHGLLSIYLVNKYKNVKVIATNIKKEKLENRIETRLGSGLDVVKAGEIDTIVIAGMGANTIVGILKYSTSKLSNVNNIIIQSNTDLYFLRKNIISLGYYIEDEILVEDKNIIYTAIKFNKGKRRYNYKELYLGPVLTTKNDDLFKKKCNKELTTLKLILKNINSGHYLYRLKIKRNIKILEDVLKH